MSRTFFIILVSVVALALWVVAIVGLAQDSGSTELLNPTNFPDRLIVFGGAGMFASMLTFIAAFLHMTTVSQDGKKSS